MKISKRDWSGLWSYNKFKDVLRTPFRDILAKLGMARLEQGPVEEMLILKGLLPSFVSPLRRPEWIPAGKATQMHADDPILGFIVEGSKPYALPWWVMKNHHVANLDLDGRPFLIDFCEACTSAAAFNPVVGNSRLTFRVAGAYKGTFVLMDYETQTIWAPFTGEALVGPRQGTRLERLPLHQATWAEWIELCPDSMVLDGKKESREGHGCCALPGTPEGQEGVFGEGVRRDFIDARLPYNELVLGVAINGHARAYPLANLHMVGPVLNDSLGGQEFVIFSRPGSWMAIAFSRHVDGRCLYFELTKNGTFVDINTESRWDLFGRASAGPLTGHSLSFVNSGIEEWQAWAAYRPGTSIYKA